MMIFYYYYYLILSFVGAFVQRSCELRVAYARCFMGLHLHLSGLPHSALHCLGTESIIPHKDFSTNTYTQSHTNCPLFAKGSKSSSKGNLESGPAALWQVGLQLTLASLK